MKKRNKKKKEEKIWNVDFFIRMEYNIYIVK